MKKDIALKGSFSSSLELKISLDFEKIIKTHNIKIHGFISNTYDGIKKRKHIPNEYVFLDGKGKLMGLSGITILSIIEEGNFKIISRMSCINIKRIELKFKK